MFDNVDPLLITPRLLDRGCNKDSNIKALKEWGFITHGFT